MSFERFIITYQFQWKGRAFSSLSLMLTTYQATWGQSPHKHSRNLHTVKTANFVEGKTFLSDICTHRYLYSASRCYSADYCLQI